jgi:hypothetical protein
LRTLQSPSSVASDRSSEALALSDAALAIRDAWTKSARVTADALDALAAPNLNGGTRSASIPAVFLSKPIGN